MTIAFRINGMRIKTHNKKKQINVRRTLFQLNSVEWKGTRHNDK